jgi:outer membrane protein assembly factor BamB/tetratricopeptide (TPR) repeat protein
MAVLGALTAALGFPASAPAQIGGLTRTGAKFHPDSSYEAERLLRAAAGDVAAKQWVEAIELYQRVITQFGDTVAEVPQDDPAAAGETTLYVDARRNCQRRLAELPPEARAIYRRRVDPQAKRWYDQGLAEQNRALLRQVVEQAFCSSWGDDAAEKLGDLAFRDGQFIEAIGFYQRLVPGPGGKSADLIHPDPDVDLARVAAKLLLCRAALGEDPPSPAELQAFAKDHADAAGTFAGRSGSIAQSLARAIADDGLAASVATDARWTTFAGAPSRTKVVPNPIDVGSFQWRVKLEPPKVSQSPNTFMINNRFGGQPPVTEPPLPYHPIVVGDQVVLCEADRIVAYNLADRPSQASAAGKAGEVAIAWEQSLPNVEPSRGRNPSHVPHYTLTAFEDRIFARLGSTDGKGASYVMAVRNNRDVEGKLLWRHSSNDLVLPNKRPGAPTGRVAYEGSPIVDAHGVYVGVTESGVMTSFYVACLDPDNGMPRWIRYLGEATSQIDQMMGVATGTAVGGRLLSLDGPTLYYQTNLGAVGALDTETGSVLWVAAYPHIEARMGAQGIGRGLNPAVVYDGLVIVAPDDSPALYAFDAATGVLRWQSEPMEKVEHLLGVAKGRLFATGDWVWTIDVKTGKVLHYWPEAGAGYEGNGRGILADGKVYWPTKNEIHVLDQATGIRSESGPIPLRAAFGTGGGNLSVGDGYLVVSDESSMVVFCQNSRLIQRYRDEIAQSPDRAESYVRLARVAEATGQDVEALKALETAIARGRPSEVLDGRPLVEAAKARRYRLLMKLGDQVATEQKWERAAEYFAAAAESALADRDGLAARLRLALAQDSAGQAGAAVATLQAVLFQERLRHLDVSADPLRTVRADLLIADRLQTLIRQRGRALYAEYDRQARRLYDEGRAAEDPRALEAVSLSYPVAEVVPDSLLALGQLQEKDHPDLAARAYKRLLTLTDDPADQANALLRLGQVYERQKLWIPARDAYALVRSRYAQVVANNADSPGGGTFGAIAAQRLARPPFDALAADGIEPSLSVPLTRRWAVQWSTGVRPLTALGTPPSTDAGRIFLTEGSMLRPIDPATGAYAWTADLEGEPLWVGFLADRVIAATSSRLVALEVREGTQHWRLDAGDPQAGRRAPNPFAKTVDPAAADPDAGKLHGFQIVGGRVFCLRGSKELLAIDGETGLIDWAYAPNAEQLNPHLLIGSQSIVLQTRGPNAIVVLETDTGRRRGEFAQADEEPAWPRPPLAVDDDHVALVVDDRTVALYDFARGVRAWTFREPAALPRSGPPRLLGDTGRLLVLRDGSELLRLDAVTGKRIWSQVLGLEDLSEWPDAITADGNLVYVANGPTLTAYNAADGAIVWRTPLVGPDSGWSLSLSKDWILAYPNPARSAEGTVDDASLVFRRRSNGALVQRILLGSRVHDLAVRLSPHLALVATENGGWAIGDDQLVDAEKAAAVK